MLHYKREVKAETMENITIIVTYKSRFTRLNVKLTNPSAAHVRKLYTTGHDILIEVFDFSGNLKIAKKLLY